MSKEKNSPSGEWGAYFHIQELIATINGFGLNKQLPEYCAGLMMWYTEVIPVLKNKNTTKSYSNFLGEQKTKKQIITDKEIEALENIKKKVEEQEEQDYYIIKNLRLFHKILNLLTHKADLRIKEGSNKDEDGVPEALR